MPDQQDRPCVTVIIPVFNREAMVRRSVESVLAQTYRDFDIIVVNDGSSDGTKAVLDSFGDQIQVLYQPNQGAYAARNLALSHSRGTYIAFLDSDDTWFPHRLQKQVPLLEESPEIALVFGNGLILRDGSVTHQFFERWQPARGMVFRELTQNNFIPQSSVLVRKRCFDEFGAFENVPLRADYHKWLQIARRYPIDYVDDALFTYAHHPGNQSKDRKARYICMLRLLDMLIAEEYDTQNALLLRRRRWQQEFEMAISRGVTGMPGLLVAVFRPREGVHLSSRIQIATRTTVNLFARLLRRIHWTRSR